MAEFYTYLDVLDRFRAEDAVNSVPPEVLKAQPLPSGVILSISTDAKLDAVKEWLRYLFGPRFLENELALALEGPAYGVARILPIDIERLDGDWQPRSKLRLRPTLTKGAFVAYNAQYAVGKVDKLVNCPPVLTFHSFKGGMGRTTLALALATAMRKVGKRVLFVDADFEAPGISSLLKHSIPSPRIAFSDLLSLAYTSTELDANDAIRTVSVKLQDQEVDGVIVLPCTRDLDLPNISPEALTLSGKRSPFFVGSLVSNLGREVGADLVIVDLRAGLSELVASLFLDPRLQHALVTTLNGQAIDGTIMLLEKMRAMATDWRAASDSAPDISLPTVIINQTPPGLVDANVGHESAIEVMEVFESELQRFIDQLAPLEVGGKQSDNPFQEGSITTAIVEAESLVSILPRQLEQAQRLLLRSTLPDQMYALFGSLVPLSSSSIAPVRANDEDPQSRRARLESYARKGIFAESQPQADIYPTTALMNLAERHQSALPTVTVIGEKGSGKSYTFMSLALSGTWGDFSAKLGLTSASRNSTTAAMILPVTPSQDLDKDARDAERLVTAACARQLTGGIPLNDQLITDRVQDQLRRPDAYSSVAWRMSWLDLIAWRAGYNPGLPDVFSSFAASLPAGRAVIAIFDGIETLLSRLRAGEHEKIAV